MPYDDQTELFYWVDENDEVLGSITRREAHSGTKKFHRSIYLLLFDTKNRLLMQKRSMNKDTFPGYWTISTSGHVTYPLSYEAALIKEVKEEIGITLDSYASTGMLVYSSNQEREICKIFTSKYTGEPIIIDEIEIERVEWIAIENLQGWIVDHPLTLAAQQVLKQLKYI